MAHSIKGLLLKIIITLIQPFYAMENISVSNWNFKNGVNEQIPLSYIFVLGALLKLFMMFECLMDTSKFKNPRGSRVCRLYGCADSYLYELKCYFKDSPVKLVVALLLFGIAFFSFSFRVSERNKDNP